MDHWARHLRSEHHLAAPGARHDGDSPRTHGDRRPPADREVPRVTDREVALRVEHDDPRVLVEPGTGLRWQVREVDARCVPAARGDRCLIFDAESVVRRLWDYPADWRQMPAEELLRLAAR